MKSVSKSLTLFLGFILLGALGCAKGSVESLPDDASPSASSEPASAPARTPTSGEVVGEATGDSVAVDETGGSLEGAGEGSAADGTADGGAPAEGPAGGSGSPEISEERRRDLGGDLSLGGSLPERIRPVSPGAIEVCYDFAFVANWRGPLNIFLANSCRPAEARRISDNRDASVSYSLLRFVPDGSKLIAKKQGVGIESHFVEFDLTRDAPVENGFTELAPHQPRLPTWRSDGTGVAFADYDLADGSDILTRPLYFWIWRGEGGGSFSRGPRLPRNTDLLALTWRWLESPALDQLIFAAKSERPGESGYDLRLFVPGTAGISYVIDHRGWVVQGKHPSIDRTGTKLAYIEEELVHADRPYESGNIKSRIMVCDLSTRERETNRCSGSRAVTSYEAVSGGIPTHNRDQYPVWMRDGARIFFVRTERIYSEGDRRYIAVERIYSVKSDGTDVRRVTEGLPTTSERWPVIP